MVGLCSNRNPSRGVNVGGFDDTKLDGIGIAGLASVSMPLNTAREIG